MERSYRKRGQREELLRLGVLIHKPTCINLWGSVEMGGTRPCFVQVWNLGWSRRRWWRGCSWQREVALLRWHRDQQQSWVWGCERARRDLPPQIKVRGEGRTVFLIVVHLRRTFIVSRQILRFCPYLNWNKKTVFLKLWIWLASKAELDGRPTWIVKGLEEMFYSWPISG